MTATAIPPAFPPRPSSSWRCADRRRGVHACAIAVALLALAAGGCDRWSPLDQGSFGKGTPDPGSDRGSLLETTDIGQFRIERRSYLAGAGSRSSRFCDYHVSFRGAPVEDLPDLNNYNSCGALLVLDTPPPLFVIGANRGSTGSYIPYFFEEAGGHARVVAREDCRLHSGIEGYSQAWLGWQVENGQIALCGRTWQVSTLEAPAPP